MPSANINDLIHDVRLPLGQLRMGVQSLRDYYASRLSALVEPDKDTSRFVLPVSINPSDSNSMATFATFTAYQIEEAFDFATDFDAVPDKILGYTSAHDYAFFDPAAVVAGFAQSVDTLSGVVAGLDAVLNNAMTINVNTARELPSIVSSRSEWLSARLTEASSDSSLLKTILGGMSSDIIRSADQVTGSTFVAFDPTQYSSSSSIVLAGQGLTDKVFQFFDDLEFNILKVGEWVDQLVDSVANLLHWVFISTFGYLSESYTFNDQARFEAVDLPVVAVEGIPLLEDSTYNAKMRMQLRFTSLPGTWGGSQWSFGTLTGPFVENTASYVNYGPAYGHFTAEEVEAMWDNAISTLRNGPVILPIGRWFVILCSTDGLQHLNIYVYPIGFVKNAQVRYDALNPEVSFEDDYSVHVRSDLVPRCSLLPIAQKSNADVVRWLTRVLSWDEVLTSSQYEKSFTIYENEVGLSAFATGRILPRAQTSSGVADITLNIEDTPATILRKFTDIGWGFIRWDSYPYNSDLMEMEDTALNYLALLNIELPWRIRVYNGGSTVDGSLADYIVRGSASFMPYEHLFGSFDTLIHAKTDSEREAEGMQAIKTILGATATAAAAIGLSLAKRKISNKSFASRAVLNSAQRAYYEDPSPENLKVLRKATKKSDRYSAILRAIGASGTASDIMELTNNASLPGTTTIDDVLAKLSEISRSITGS